MPQELLHIPVTTWVSCGIVPQDTQAVTETVLTVKYQPTILNILTRKVRITDFSFVHSK